MFKHPLTILENFLHIFIYILLYDLYNDRKNSKKIVILVALIASIGYLSFANKNYLWPFQGSEKIRVFVETGTSDDSIEVLKNDIELLPSVIDIEEVPWPNSENEYSGAVRLIITVRHNPNDIRVTPLDYTNFLKKGETDPSHSSNLIQSWSSTYKTRNLLDIQLPFSEPEVGSIKK